MCGIAGLINLDRAPVSPADLRAMTDAIAHRGPDGEGQWIEANVGIGHRRLAIIDLSPAGHQPMVSADHRFLLSYNGEVYNFRELRTELEARGYWFRSGTDSEVVLNALAFAYELSLPHPVLDQGLGVPQGDVQRLEVPSLDGGGAAAEAQQPAATAAPR